MDRLRYRAHARRRKEAVGGKGTRGRPRHAKDKRSIMRTVFQGYKDAEKSLQDEEGSSVANRRMSIPRRMYTHGRHEGNKSKGEIGLSAEVKARANSNLSDIIALAREQLSHPPPPNTVSPERSFLPKKGSSRHQSKRPSDDTFSQDTSSSSPDVPVNPPGKKTAVQADQPGTSCQPKPAKEKPRAAGSSESKTFKKPPQKAESKQTNATADKIFMFEYLMTAVNEVLEENTSRILGAKGMSADVVKKIHKKYEKRRMKEEGTQTHSRGEGSGSIEVIHSIKHHDVYQRPTDVLKTPSCLDFLCASLMDSPIQSEEDEEVDAGVERVLGKSCCPSTTIMNPYGLLEHHEKLQTRKGVLRGPQHYASEYKKPQVSPTVFDASLFNDPGQCHDRVLTRDRPKCDRPVEFNRHDLQGFGNQRTPSPVPTTSKFVSQCPKSVVVDPLHYLERFAGQPRHQGNPSTQGAARAGGGYINVGQHSYTSRTLADINACKEIHPHHSGSVPQAHQSLGQGSLVDTEPYGPVRSGMGHATNTSYEHSYSWQREGNRMHQTYGEGHALEGITHVLPTTQQDLHNILQGHQQHPNKGTHESTNAWVDFPANHATQQPRPLLNLTDDIFQSYHPGNRPQPQPPLPPPPVARPPGRQSPVNTDYPSTKEKLRDIFRLTPTERKSVLTFLQSEERTAPVVTSHQSHRAGHSTSRNTRYTTSDWSAREVSKFSQSDQVALSHAQQKGGVKGTGCGVCLWGRQNVGGMYCGRSCSGHSAPPHTATQCSHGPMHTSHWHS